jgi:organic hydroperoxide reductase OsmC/OhrA
MSTYTVALNWNRNNARFTDNRYSRAHAWHFDGGVTVPASSSPHLVPLPYSDATAVDPEEAFVAALSSCHMLSFLSIAAKNHFVVDEYRDEAIGFMGRNESGKEAMTLVMLKPHVLFSGGKTPTDVDVQMLHHEAHEVCYLANSVRTKVETNGTWSSVAELAGTT